MAISSRQGLIDYCLRRLGFPVIEINVDEDQVSDRIDDALQYFQEFHFDGVERVYLKHQVTGASLNLASYTAANFELNEVITGQSSDAFASVYAVQDSNTLTIGKITGTFTAGETVTGASSGYSAALAASTHFENGDIQNGYLAVTDGIIGVIKVLPIHGASTGSSNANNMFDLVYQFRLNDMYNLLGADMTYYTQVKQNLDMLDMLLVGQRSIRFNRKMDKLMIDVNWNEVFTPGEYIIVECYKILDPTVYTKVYNDMFLKRYSTALIKRQWGENMKKFGGIQLPGGTTLNGGEIYQEAFDEIKVIEEEMQLRSELPIDFMVG
jgi:hypothetical protein